MNLNYVIAACGLVVAVLIVRAALRGRKADAAEPETQDDLAASMARWGHLHDQRWDE